jgi:serine/threonine protein kinase/predicted negative regulator of RcsB-dependent stress response
LREFSGDATLQDLSGRKLGQYELRERLGRGGMAEVYKSYQPGMDRFVAVKVMLGSLNDDESFVERFRREARAVGNLRHAHIVQAFDFGAEDGVYYLAMEFIQGDNLKTHIQKHGKLPMRDSLRIARQLSDALAYAHDKGMVHRDMKPANIMFLDDSLKHAILTDFGIARILGEVALTGTGMAVGTPDYMSPEAGRGDITDHRTDIYALGIILYEMLVGDVPYSADTPLAVIMKHINAPLPTRSDHDDAIPESIETIILRCMAKDPEDRFQSAHDMTAALDKAIAELDGAASTVAQPLPTRPATTLSAARDTKPTTFGLTDAATEAVPASELKPTSQSSNPTLWGLGAVAAIVIIALIAFFALNNNGDNPTPTTEPEVALNATAEDTEAAAIVEATVAATDAPVAETTVEATADSAAASTNSTIPYTAQMPPMAENLMLTSGIAPIVDEVEMLLVENNQEAALEAANAVLETEPDNLEALFARSLAYSHFYDNDGLSLIDANRIIELAPDSPLGYIAQAHAYPNIPNYSWDDSAIVIEQVHEIAPDNIHVMWRWAGFSDYETRLNNLDEAESQGARGWQYITLAADVLYDHDEYERAIPYLYIYATQPLNTEYYYWEARWKLLGALIQTGQEEAALDVAESYLPEIEGFSEPWWYSIIAYVAFRADEYELARNWANTAVALNGDEHSARYVLALLEWYENENADAAIEQLTALLDVQWGSPLVDIDFGNDPNLDMARILMAAGRTEEALPYYNAAADYYYQAWLFEERADLHLDLGDTEAARADLQSALDLADDDEYRRALLQRIIDLGPAPTSTPEE